jgi:hypothetical protein
MQVLLVSITGSWHGATGESALIAAEPIERMLGSGEQNTSSIASLENLGDTRAWVGVRDIVRQTHACRWFCFVH